MAAFSVTSALTKGATTYDNFETYATTLTGSTSTEFYTTALKGFSGDAMLVGTITSGAACTIGANAVVLQISMDGTNWGTVKAGVWAAWSGVTGTQAFTIDATGITAPYYRIYITADAYSNTLLIKYCTKKN
jgi:hypothetical protein